MKQILVYFLAVTMCLPMFSKVSTFVSWKINQEYITKNLCVNKDKPILKCNGKCHLKKSLNEDEGGKDAKIPQKIKELQLQPLMFKNIMAFDHLIDEDDFTRDDHFNIVKFISLLRTESILDPPDYIA